MVLKINNYTMLSLAIQVFRGGGGVGGVGGGDGSVCREWMGTGGRSWGTVTCFPKKYLTVLSKYETATLQGE